MRQCCYSLEVQERAKGIAPKPGPVLVVDDYPDARATLRDMLEELGQDVVEASNGQEAFDFLLSHPDVRVQLILLDLDMPRMTGWELLPLLKSYMRFATIPVLVVSRHTPYLRPKDHSMIDGYIEAPSDTDLVQRLHWLTEGQLIDAIAVGQVTPEPVFTTATFIGYVLAGPSGALVATAGILLPAFVFVALSGPLVPKLRASPVAGAFLDGVNVASLALMAVVTLQLGRAALIDAPTILLAGTSAALLVRFKINATWLVLGGAAAGWAVHAAGVGTS